MLPLAEPEDTAALTQVRHIPACSVVRFPDGRMGWLGDQKRTVWFGGRRGKKIALNTELEVIYTPDELAAEYIKGL